MFDTAEYVLAWPPAVLRHELRWLLRQQDLDRDPGAAAAELVLIEAFVGEDAVEEFRALRALTASGPWNTGAVRLANVLNPNRREFLEHLLAQAGTLPQQGRRRPYWSTRHGQHPRPKLPEPPIGPSADTEQRLREAMGAWADAVRALDALGYLAQAAPRPCVDDDVPPPQPDGVLAVLLHDELGMDDLWPLRPDEWDEVTFYSLIEAVGDLLARPRRRTWHSWNGCGWHYYSFAVAPARLLYRSRVDVILARTGLNLRLAAEGEDAGRLVRTSDDGRDEVLVTAVLVTPDAGDRAAVEHAVALFRARAATREDKRSAVVALARLLEDRRALLKAELARKDEGALFQIANEFDVRHRGARQHDDYDEAFLDWVFWWYLATVELTDRLLARQGSTP